MSNAPVFSLSASQKLLFGYIILMILTKVQSQGISYCTFFNVVLKYILYGMPVPMGGGASPQSGIP